jgi:tetratricopeptide (TPR) repeat protein
MTILSALFTLAGCLWYLNRRPRAVCGRDVILLVCGIGVFTLLAFLCKETGALLPGFVLLVEATLFRFAFGPGVKAPARILLAASLCLPAVAILLYLCGEYFQHRDALAANWHFTGHERFLTQFRALLHYAGWIGLPGTAPMGLYHDDFPLSRGLVDPPATLFALFFWCAAFVGGIALARRRQVLGFGVLWFLWGHVIESSTIPLAPVFEHRNYLPGLGLALALGALLYEAMAQVRLGPATRHAILAAVLVLLPAVQLAERAGAWSDKAAFIERSLRDHPESALTLMTAAAFLNGHGNPEAAIQALREARRLDPRDASPALAEAAVRCEHWPGERFPDDLRRTLGSAGMERLRAATARLHFVFVARFCAVSSVNDDVLLPLYERHRESRNGNLAVASLFGAGVIYLRSGRTEEARAAWETALSGYPEGEAIRPWIEEFRRR